MHQRIRGWGRTSAVLGLAAWLGACGLSGRSEPTRPAPSEPSAAAGDWPSTPVSAFRPTVGGTCPARYTLAGTTCVHEAMRSRVSASELDQKLAAYRSGAASPRVGGGPAPVTIEEPVAALDPDDPSQLPPDAFTKKRKDAAEAKAARLEELETLIRNARIRAGEKVEDEQPATARMLDPQARNNEKKQAENAKLSELTEGLPPDVLQAVLVEIQRNGGTTMVSLEELQALEAQAKQAERTDKKK